MARRILSLTFFLLSYLLIQCTKAEKPSLVIEIFRHGARGPLNQTFDPNQDWEDEVEQLTAVGMRMHYLLGAALKQQYKHLLTKYDPDEIYIRSTDVNRTIMSAYSHMYGVYGKTGPSLGNISADGAIPPYNSPIIPEMVKNLSSQDALPDNLQVVPVHVVPVNQDFILASYIACPKSGEWMIENQEDENSMNVFVQELSEVTAYLQSKGLQIETFKDLFYASDNAIANVAQNKELPGYIDPESQYYKDMQFAFEWYTTKSNAGSSNQILLYPIDILNEIARYMGEAIKGSSNLKFAFLSAHDTTLLTLLNAFKIMTKDCLLENYKAQKQNQTLPYPNCHYPQFASNLIFEFYNVSEPYVKFYYDGYPVSFCDKGSNTCTYKEFLAYIQKITHNYTPEDYKDKCEFPEVVMASSMKKYKLLVILLGIISFMSIGALIFLLAKKSKGEQTQSKKNNQWMPLPEEKTRRKTDIFDSKKGQTLELSSKHSFRT